MSDHKSTSQGQGEGTQFNPKFNPDDLWNNAGKDTQQDNEPAAEFTNPFPVDVFPPAVQEIIAATNECLNYPTDFIGASILYAVAIATGNTYRVQVRNGWWESAVLFIANVGRPNTVKSHPLSFALQPILDKQIEKYSDYNRKKKKYDCEMDLSKEERQKQGIEEPMKPILEKYTVTDFTPEALANVHKYNSRGIGVYVDELAGWFKNFNRYHKGAEAETWLSIWSCKLISIDRKGSEPLLIPIPFIPVGGNIQTSILYELAKDSRAQNGFIDRILFAFPQGLQKPYWSDKELQPRIIEKWKNIITKILSIELKLDENMNPAPDILKFTPDAAQILTDWQKQNTDLCNFQSEVEGNDTLAGVYGKFDIYAVRLALILEMLYWSSNDRKELVQQVGIDAVNGAIHLIEYFRNTAKKVHAIISSNNPLDRLPDNQRKFYEALPDTFTSAEGFKVAELQKIPFDTFNKWLKRFTETLLKKIKKGEYEKLV